MAAPSLLLLLIPFLCVSSGHLTSTENDDGSYSSSVGNTGSSVLALLSQSSGWTEDELADQPSRQYGVPPASSNPYGNRDGSYGALHINPGGLLAPHAEILSLVEGFIKLKGEVASRFHALLADNWDIIRGVYNVLISKVSTLHSFSLTGIMILRKIVEFAVACFSQWEITVPSISYSGSHQSSGSVSNSYGTPSTASASFNTGGYY